MNKPYIKEIKKVSFSLNSKLSHTFWLDDVIILNLYKGIIFSCSTNSDTLSIINLFDTKKIIFFIDIRRFIHSKYDFGILNFIITKNKKYIYLSCSNKLLSISTKSYKLTVVNHGNPISVLANANTSNNIVFLEWSWGKNNKNKLFDLREWNLCIYTENFNLVSKRRIKKLLEDRFNFLILSNDDKYFITNSYSGLSMYDINNCEFIGEIELGVEGGESIRKGFFSNDGKYLIVSSIVYMNDINGNPEYTICYVIDFENKTLLYRYFDKLKKEPFYNENYGIEVFNEPTFVSYNMSLSNDGLYCFPFLYDAHTTLPFEIKTGKLLNLKNNHRFFFDLDYPNLTAMLNYNEYILAEIDWSKIYEAKQEVKYYE